MMLLIAQTILGAVAAMSFFDWRKERKVWQLLCSIYMVAAVFVVGCVGSYGGVL